MLNPGKIKHENTDTQIYTALRPRIKLRKNKNSENWFKSRIGTAEGGRGGEVKTKASFVAS